MSDFFSLKTVQITPELGMALKNFRIENEVTATSIVEEFSKSSSYITKLEKGEIKKIDGELLLKLCNYITKTDNGLSMFLSKLSRDFREYSSETKITIINIDDLLIDHTVSPQLISDINNYLESHNISIEQLVNKINANEDIQNNIDFETAPKNEWIVSGNSSDEGNYIIKLDIPCSYIENLLAGKITTIHFVIGKAILYSLYRLGNEDDAATLANSKLQINNIIHYVRPNYIAFNDENMDNLFGGLPVEASEALQFITSTLKLVTNLTKENGYGPKRIQQIKANLESDLGFTFAFMSLNIEELAPKSKAVKEEFLKELKTLIEKYSQADVGLDIYD